MVRVASDYDTHRAVALPRQRTERARQLLRYHGLRRSLATIDGLRLARYTMHFDDSKARRELGHASRPYRDALIEAIEWFIGAGYMKRPRRMQQPAKS